MIPGAVLESDRVMDWTIAELVTATGGRLVQGSPGGRVRAVTTDSRDLQPGDCFVALRGERFDGHDFILQVLARGAAAVVAESWADGAAPAGETALIQVDDTLYALGQMARHHRDRVDIPVVGVTGSNGKTSTKEMLAAILGMTRKTLKNEKSFNNFIGLPLTLLALSVEHEAAVVEMGVNTPGEMTRLLEIARPTIGLVTNIHPAHLEGLESRERILAEKGRLLEALGADELAVVNLDDDLLRTLGPGLRAHTVTYSLMDSRAQVRLVGDISWTVDEGGKGVEGRFDLALDGQVIPVSLRVLGRHQVQNAVAAAAVAYGMGEPPEAIVSGLALHRPVKQRMELHRLPDSTVIVDDTYNANPMSVAAAIKAVREACGSRELIAVLGEMREMGVQSALMHHELGRELNSIGMDRLYTLGELAGEIANGAIEAGMSPEKCRGARSHDEIVRMLRDKWPEGAWILVKGSRGAVMERVVEGIMK